MADGEKGPMPSSDSRSEHGGTERVSRERELERAYRDGQMAMRRRISFTEQERFASRRDFNDYYWIKPRPRRRRARGDAK